MRRAAKVDANHRALVDALRRLGASVVSLAAVGRGVPDLLVGWRGRNFLLEVKDGDKAPSRRRLTPDELAFQDAWRGQVATVENLDGALALLTEKQNGTICNRVQGFGGCRHGREVGRRRE